MPKARTVNRSAMTYVALRRLKVGTTWRNPGSAVPEAAGWRNLHNYISAGYIKIVGVRANNPNVKQGKFAYTMINKAQGNKPYTNHRPITDDLVPASVPVDQT